MAPHPQRERRPGARRGRAPGGRVGLRVRTRRRRGGRARRHGGAAACDRRDPASNGAADAPTVLLYGHFDVQPPAPLELWESPPFEPELRDGYLYARGAVDDKGNSYLLLKAAELLAREGALPVNVRVAFDGEEEIGGRSIVDFLAADERGADACVIFDAAMPREDVPGLRPGHARPRLLPRAPANRRARPPLGPLRRRGAERGPRAHADARGGRRRAGGAPRRASSRRRRRSWPPGPSSTRAPRCSPREAPSRWTTGLPRSSTSARSPGPPST